MANFNRLAFHSNGSKFLKVYRSVSVPQWELKYEILEVNQLVEYYSRYNRTVYNMILWTLFLFRAQMIYPGYRILKKGQCSNDRSCIFASLLNVYLFYIYLFTIYYCTFAGLAIYVSCQVILADGNFLLLSFWYYTPINMDFKFMLLENSRSVELWTNCRIQCVFVNRIRKIVYVSKF